MSNLSIPEIYLFQISYGLAANPSVSWRLNKEAKLTKEEIPDLRKGGKEQDLRKILARMNRDFTDSLLLKIHDDGRLNLGEDDEKVQNPHLMKTRYLEEDLERHHFDWEENELQRVRRLLPRYEHLCKIGEEKTANEFFRELSIDPRTGMGTKFGYVYRKLLRDEIIGEVFQYGLPEGIAEFVLTADVCSMKTGNQNIGEEAVDHYLDAAGKAFSASLRIGTDLFSEENDLNADLKDYARSLTRTSNRRAFSLGNLGTDVVMGSLGYSSATLRPNGSGGDEMVASLITSTDPDNLVGIVDRINNSIYTAMSEVQNKIRSGELHVDCRGDS